MSSEKQVILVQSEESIARSAHRDAVTFGALCATAWFLNTQMEPSAWINATVAICWFIWVFGRAQQHIMTPAQAREHLEALALTEREKAQ